MKAKVLFTKELTPAGLTKIYEALQIDLPGKVAVKIHSGEPGGNNFLKADFMKDLVQKVNGTIVEANTAYEGKRNTAEDHYQTMQDHGFTAIAPVDIMDEEGEMTLPIPNGKHLQVDYVGSHYQRYDSFLVLSHFKGHAMGGFGGALKNISIGIASAHGKAYIHGVGIPENLWTADQHEFVEAMAEAASAIMHDKKGKIAFINVMCNLSIDCDCDAHPHAPAMQDIGILASLDPVALDQACVDLIYQSSDPGKTELIKRMEEKQGIHILETAEELQIGSREYELITLD